MKKILMINAAKVFLVFIIIGNHLSAQTTLVLKPDAVTGKCVYLDGAQPSANIGHSVQFSSVGWTCSGNPCYARSIIQFDLTSIPTNAVVTDARLSLYAYPNPNNGAGVAMYGTANTSLLQRITSSWNENTATWNNQPNTTTQNEVVLLQSTSSTQNYLNIDVKYLVQDMVDNPSASFGFMLQLQTQNYYNSMIFASNNYSDSTLRPSLTITYDTATTSSNDTCTTIIPDAVTGKCVYVDGAQPSTNIGHSTQFSSVGWTCSGNPCYARSIIQFDLTSIPANAVITDSKMSLYAYPNPNNGGGVAMYGTANTSLLQRITSSWNENTVSWNTQPNTTIQNQVILSQSSSSAQNYLNIDVKNLVQDMINSPSTSFGFMLRLQVEGYYNSMIFASNNYSDINLRPSLKICYEINSGLNNIKPDPEVVLEVFPNPFSGQANVSYVLNKRSNVSVEIYDILNRRVYYQQEDTRMPGKHEFVFNIEKYFSPANIYFLKMVVDGRIITKKLISIN